MNQYHPFILTIETMRIDNGSETMCPILRHVPSRVPAAGHTALDRCAARILAVMSLSVMLTLLGLPSLTTASDDHSGTTQANHAEDIQLPLYTPPKQLTPRARVGGALRGTEGNEPEIVALVPDHVGLTVKQTPTLNWFLSKPTDYPLVFTLNNTKQLRPVYEGPLPTPTQAGVQSIDLKSLDLTLEPNIQYRWFVSAKTNPDSPSQDIVAGGMIERCEYSECLMITTVNTTCDPNSVRTNAMASMWYEAIACVSALIEQEPNDSSLRRLRAALLRQVGLNGVAEWDLKSIHTTKH